MSVEDPEMKKAIREAVHDFAQRIRRAENMGEQIAIEVALVNWVVVEIGKVRESTSKNSGISLHA